MNKEQLIKESWEAIGIDFSTIENELDENGWHLGDVDQIPKDSYEQCDHYSKSVGKMAERPKSLRGLEDNNGWIKINDEDDFPRSEGEYTLMFTNQQHTNKIVDHIWFKSADLLWKCTTHYRIKQQLPKPLY